MHLANEGGGYSEHVAWIPAKLARIGKHVLIDGMPGRWKVVSAGEARPEYLVDWYAEHGRTGLPDGSGPSTPMRDAEERLTRK